MQRSTMAVRRSPCRTGRWGGVRAAAILAGLALATGGQPADAGGGPENVFLVVNPKSPSSLAVANAWITLRQVAPINVFMLPWEGSKESVPIARFREEILAPILQAIDSRRLTSQIDQIVYSSDFPWKIDFTEELPAPLVGQDHFPAASLTGLTLHYTAVQARRPGYLEKGANRYWRALDDEGVPLRTQGFRAWYGWGLGGEVLEAGGPRYLLSTMLGVTSGRGNSVAEVVAALASASEADGRKPLGTIYFATNGDVRTKTRSPGFPAIVKEIRKLGVKAEVFEGALPPRKRDVAGLMTGTPDFEWPKSGSTVVPGAICENLTSYGGIFTEGVGQTPLSAFIRAGASGSSGTVIEPYALQEKFPHPSIQVHYVRGASLAEAFYQSLQVPYQLLVVGDPLCQPWATIPEITATTQPDDHPLEGGRILSEKLAIEPFGTLPEGTVDTEGRPVQVDRFEFFIDGMRAGQCSAGERYTLDTATLPDGHHELRVVGIVSSSIETQGRLVVPFTASNRGRTLGLGVHPDTVRADGTVRVTVAGKGLEGVTLFCNGCVIGRVTGAEAAVEVPANVLGVGTVQIRATGRAGFGTANMVTAEPVTVTVLPAK